MRASEQTSVRPTRLRDPADGIWKYLVSGILVSVLLVGGAGGWAATTSIVGAVIANGVVVVESRVKKVQHPTGGVVGKIMVKEGDHVQSGDLLIRLDETVTMANLQLVVKQLDELVIRKARLQAERDGAQDIVIPKAVTARLNEPEIAEIVHGEKTLFLSRRKAMEGQKAQLRERAGQFDAEIEGLRAQKTAKATEVVMIREELSGLQILKKKSLVPQSRLTAMLREVTRIEGERAQLQASIAKTKGRIAEIKLQILQLGREMESQVIKELREVQASEAQLGERRIAAQDLLSRIDIRAPKSGIVHQLSVHTVGGVVSAGEALMLIVPGNDKLVIEAKIAPEDIANVAYKQTVFIRFIAFNQRTTPEFFGEVVRVGADLTIDAQARISYYTVKITLPPNELKRMGDLKLVPGMPVEVHLKTSERTALSYLLRPLRDQMQRVFKRD